jgi:hypothetical protein
MRYFRRNKKNGRRCRNLPLGESRNACRSFFFQWNRRRFAKKTTFPPLVKASLAYSSFFVNIFCLFWYKQTGKTVRRAVKMPILPPYKKEKATIKPLPASSATSLRRDVNKTIQNKRKKTGPFQRKPVKRDDANREAPPYLGPSFSRRTSTDLSSWGSRSCS